MFQQESLILSGFVMDYLALDDVKTDRFPLKATQC